MNQTKVLITGSNGLLGQKLIRHCLDKNIPFIATAATHNRISFCPSSAFKKLDVTHFESIVNILQTEKPTHVINTAAMTNVDACETEKEKCYTINRDGVQNLLSAIQGTSIHLLHISTDFIFDGNKKSYEEEDKAHPLGEYGKSKWEGEKILLASKHPFISILRTSLLYGNGEKLNKDNIFSWAIEKLRQGSTLNIVNDQFRTPTFADDIATACLQAIQLKAYGVFHISTAPLRSMYAHILEVAKYVGVKETLINPISTQHLNQKAPRPQSSGLIITKAKKTLSFTPTPFLETLKSIDKFNI